ncbi:MAG: hypothetical protein ABSF27_06255 [Candidatus Dormibacteria bacterium]
MTRIEVRCGGPLGEPAAVELGGGWMEVTAVVESWWVEVGWWRALPERPVRRRCWRVLLSNGSCLDLRWDQLSNSWDLERGWG